MQSSILLILLNMVISTFGGLLCLDQVRQMTHETCREARLKYVAVFTFFVFSFWSFVYTQISMVNVLLSLGVTVFVTLDALQRKNHVR